MEKLGKQAWSPLFSAFLLAGSFAAGLFFRGTDSLMLLPHMVPILVFGFLTLWPGFKAGWAWPRSTVVVILLLYWLYVWVSTFPSTAPYNSHLFALIFSVLPFTFLTLILAQKPLQSLRLYMGTLGAALAVLSSWALIQFFVLEPGERVHRPMLNPNNLAALFNMGVFPALALYFSAQNKRLAGAGFALSLLYFLAMLTTQSRGGLLAFLVCLCVFAFFVYENPHFTLKRLFALSGPALAGFTLIHILSNGTLGSAFLEIMTPGSAQGPWTVTERKMIWSATGEIIREHFWTGTGLGTFFYFYPRHRFAADRSDGYFSHMDPLQFWAEMGVLAPILFYAVLIAVLVRTVHAARVCTPDTPGKIWLGAFFCGLLTLAGHAHISFHLYMPVILLLAALLLAGWYISGENILGEDRILLRIKDHPALLFAGRSLFILLLTLPILWLTQSSAGIYFIQKAHTALIAERYEESRTALDKARRFGPSTYAPLYDYEARYRLALLTRASAQMPRKERSILYREAHDYSDRAIALNSGFATLWVHKAQLYLAGFPVLEPQGREKAEKLLKKALEANPLLLSARFGLVNIYRSKGTPGKARLILEEALRYPIPKSPATLHLYDELARLAFSAGDLGYYNNLIKRRNEFARRYGLPVARSLPLSRQDIQIFQKHVPAPQ